MPNKEYWKKICGMQEKQTQKGIDKYGQILEENTGMDMIQRITYLEEELIDALMYCEHIKELFAELEGKECKKNGEI